MSHKYHVCQIMLKHINTKSKHICGNTKIDSSVTILNIADALISDEPKSFPSDTHLT